MQQVPTHTLLSWYLGRGTVVSIVSVFNLFNSHIYRQIWKIWPSVLLLSLFSAGI